MTLIQWVWVERVGPLCPKVCQQQLFHIDQCLLDVSLHFKNKWDTIKYMLLRSPFSPLFTQNLVPFLKNLGPLSMWEQCVRVGWKVKKKFYGKEVFKKITWPQFRFLGPETNSEVFSHGWDDMLFVSDLKTPSCGGVILNSQSPTFSESSHRFTWT